MATWTASILVMVTASCIEGVSVQSSFDAYVSKMGRSYQAGSEEYKAREAMFKQRLKDVLEQNQREGRLWTAELNKFSDWTHEELKALGGWKHSGHHPNEGFSLAEIDDATEKADLPGTVSWQNLTTAVNVPDQGSCGSCWAITTVAVLEAHTEIYRKQQKHFSAQELVACVPNPQECGGQGGCKGATVELGMAWILKNDLRSAREVPYLAADSSCSRTSLLNLHSSSNGKRHAHGGATSFGLTAFQTLPSNKMAPLMRAVAEKGPIAISAAASGWFLYKRGIFDRCNSWILDHAVTLYGYGQENGQKYWLIRNSWGSDWGEKGFIRLLRTDADDTQCGLDTKAQEGVACKNDPSQVTVCGCNGMLYDSVAPTFVAQSSLLAAHHKEQPEGAFIGAAGQTKLIRHEE